MNTNKGKHSHRLQFPEEQQNPKLNDSSRKANKLSTKLSHAARDAPGYLVSSRFQHIMRESDDNSAIEAANSGFSAVEVVNRTMQRWQTIPNASAYSHASSRLQQKKAIRQEYAKARYAKSSESSTKASEIASKAAAMVTKKTKQAAGLVKRNWKPLLIILALAALLMVVMSIISSCSMMFQGIFSSVCATTYPSKPEDMVDVENGYKGKEIDLQEKLDHYTSLYPYYDEYHISGTVLGHEPHVLASMLSAICGKYTLSDVQGMLDSIFDMQYQLGEKVETETRYWTETRTDYYQVYDPETGETYLVPYTYTVEVPYEYTICTVKLACISMEDIVDMLLTDEQKKLYEVYMSTKGNYPDLFSH